jgi:hypothetical protein
LVNGLVKLSAADVLQVRGIDVVRCIRKVDTLEQAKLGEIIKATVAILGYSNP